MVDRPNQNHLRLAKTFVAFDDLTDLEPEHFRQSCVQNDRSWQTALNVQHGLDAVMHQQRRQPPALDRLGGCFSARFVGIRNEYETRRIDDRLGRLWRWRGHLHRRLGRRLRRPHEKDR